MNINEALNKSAQDVGWRDFDNLMFNYYANSTTTRLELDSVIHRAMELYAMESYNQAVDDSAKIVKAFLSVDEEDRAYIRGAILTLKK